MTKRAALYARYSSDLSSDRSIDDQLELCRTFCARQDLAVVATFDDRAISGASLHGRAGVAALVLFALANRCDVVVVEALDRLSRDMGDLSTIFKQLQFAGVELRAVHDGVADQVQIGVRGIVGALYLTDLAKKIRRGMAGNVRAGKRPSGLPFGYRTVAGKPGEHVVYEPEAAIVRRIFAAYAAGESPLAIAAALNAEKIKPSRGTMWRASTILGGAKRSSGMLSNDVYRGEIVWNKVGKIKNPANGRRVPRPNAPADWQRAPAEQLRIVDDATWNAVQAVRAQRSRGPMHTHRRPPRLLSGLVKCGVCGAGVVSIGLDHGRPRAMCAAHTNGRACSNNSAIYLDTLENGVLDVLRAHLKDPRLVIIAAREYHEERQRLSRERAGARASLEKRLAETRRSRDRLIDQIADGSVEGRVVGAKLSALAAEVDQLEAKLEAAPPPEVLTLHPAVMDRYVASIEALALSLASGADREAMTHIRTLIERVVVQPRSRGEELRFEFVGRLMPLFGGVVGDQWCRRRESYDAPHLENPVFVLLGAA